METLADQTCVPCREGAPKLTGDQIGALRPRVPEWEIVERDGEQRLTRTFSFEDFAGALAFTNAVGTMAEAQDHHPTIVTEWGSVTVTWWTHAIGGLHRNDFIAAAKTDRIYADKTK